MSEGGVSYLNKVAKLMQNWGYVYLVLFDFTNNSIMTSIVQWRNFEITIEDTTEAIVNP
jgi:hypothetical protein